MLLLLLLPLDFFATSRPFPFSSQTNGAVLADNINPQLSLPPPKRIQKHCRSLLDRKVDALRAAQCSILLLSLFFCLRSFSFLLLVCSKIVVVPWDTRATA